MNELPEPTPTNGVDETFFEFRQEFPTQVHCWAFILNLLRHCRSKCKCGEPIEFTEERYVYCRSCRRKNWITAGTLFHAMKERPDVWVAAIFFHVKGVLVSGNRLAILLNASQAGVANALAKVRLALNSFMDNGLEIQFNSSDLRTVYSRRSIETPAREHPEFEEDEMRKRVGGGRANNDSDTASVEPVANAEDILIDTITGPTADDVSVRRPQLKDPDSETRQSNQPGNADVDLVACLGPFVETVKRCWKGVSRKYVQLYLVSFWCKAFHDIISTQDMLEVLGKHKYISDAELKSYVSPLRLKFGQGSLNFSSD